MVELPDADTLADLDRLRPLLAPLGGAAVAFSGGVDSALVLRACTEFLPADRVVAVTGRSESLKEAELERASALAASLGVRHEVVATLEMEREEYRRNDGLRCFHCKTELYARVREVAHRLGLPVLLDGLNADDDPAERPGARAAAEASVRSPLRDAGLGKARVRRLARHLGLPVWDKPAEPCLSSRIPFGTPVTVDRLDRVRRAEAVLEGLGFPVHRVRHHGDVARVEIPPADFPRLMEPGVRERILEGVRAAGFPYVAVDLAGFRSGSAHEAFRRAGGEPV